jgi:uncharacterized protein YrrD
MHILARQLKGLPVISLQTGQTVAFLSDPIINPANLELMAFRLDTGKGKRESTVLLVRDIRQLSPDGALIDSADELEDASEIIRLKEVIDGKFSLPGAMVITESGSRLGKVDNYTINPENSLVQKIHVRQSLLRDFFMSNLIIDRQQIVDVTTKQIVVRDADIKEPAMAATPVAPE